MNGGKSYGNGRAEIRLVDGVHYRRDCFFDGLHSLGFRCSGSHNEMPNRGDVLVLWNRYARDEHRARQYEAAGGHVLITENAWLGPEEKDLHYFALCQGHHNGAGIWKVGPTDRWSQLSIPLLPWREDGDHLLVLPQRGMGEDGVRMPRGWRADVCRRLLKAGLPARVREHPGPRPHGPIDFGSAYAAVTWASGSAIKAICAGVPVFYEFKKWIGAPAARFSIEKLDEPYRGERIKMLNRLAWAQWSAEEIGSGEPFRWLLPLRLLSQENSEPVKKSALT